MADEAGGTLTIIDAATNAATKTVTGLRKPHNVQVGRDGAIVYAVSGGDNLVVAIDAATYALRVVAATGPAPAHVVDAPMARST